MVFKKILSERIGPGQVMLSNLAGQYYNSWGRKRKKIAVSHYFSTANNNKKQSINHMKEVCFLLTITYLEFAL